MNVEVVNEEVMKNIAILDLPTKGRRLPQVKELSYKVAKRTVDIIGATIGVLVLVPMVIGIAIAKVILKDKGPIFYTQNRIGKDGKIFKMYKFRSMVVGADKILEKYLAENEEAREEWRVNKKLKDDPRVTKIGKFIRKTSIDEFPQFINVLKGDMSLVGPRPYLPKEREDIGSYYPYIVAVKPGITGLWQVSGRSDVSFEQRLNLDLEYYENRSAKLYFKILGNTVRKVFLKEGAV